MKRLLLILSVFCFLIADSPVGNWKLSGLKVDYINIARMTRTVALQDAYGVGVNIPVSSVPGGAVFYRLTNGPFTMSQIDNYPLNLNVNLYQDGTGAVAQGSFYPDIELIPGTCITSPQIFPVTDNFTFTVGDETVFPDVYKTVLLARSRYYVHQFKEDTQAAAFALEDYKRGIRLMKLHLMEPTPGYFKDDRVRFV